MKTLWNFAAELNIDYPWVRPLPLVGRAAARLAFLLSLLFAGGILQARAELWAGSGDPFTFGFDENGHGLLDLRNGNGVQPLTGMLLPDPTQPGNPLALTYLLPGPMFNGDVRIWDDASHTVLSDVLCFTDANGNLTGQTANRMIFYSQAPGPDKADTGFPATLFPNDGGGVVEAANGTFLWDPGGPTDNIFNGVSEVPEPGVLALLGLGAGAWRAAKRRK